MPKSPDKQNGFKKYKEKYGTVSFINGHSVLSPSQMSTSSHLDHVINLLSVTKDGAWIVITERQDV